MKNVKSRGIIIIAAMLILAASMSIFCGLSVSEAKSADFERGEGTKSDPYIISTPFQLNMVRYHLDAYFLQTENLDMSEYAGFAPIGSVTFPFTGHYDGGKYSVSNLTIDSDENNVGLFSCVYNGTVENLKIKNSKISGAYNVGAIAGANKGRIVGCVNEASVYGKGVTGGVAGINSAGGTVAECGNLGKIEGEELYSGGIAGINDGVIDSCYNRGEVNVQANDSVYSGGIVGKNNGGETAEIIKSYSAGNIGGKAKGMIAGDNSGLIDACIFEEGDFSLIASFNKGRINESRSLNRDGFRYKESFDIWNDFSEKWMYTDNSVYPSLIREYVAVSSVEFSASKIELKPGESYALKAAVNPMHATAQEVDYEISDYNNSADFDAVSNTIRIKDAAKIGSAMTVKAIAEGHTAILIIEVVKIPVERVEISSVSGRTSVSAASSLAFSARIFPHNASFNEVSYSVNSSYADIDGNGILTLKDNAPIGAVIKVTATATDNGNAFDSMEVTIVGEPVQSVKVIADNSFKVTESLKLGAAVYPSNATNKEVTYRLVSATAAGTRLIDDMLYADGLGEIVVTATADGVNSEEFTVRVLKEPVTGIEFDTDSSFICSERLPLIAEALPFNATYRSITFEIVENNAQAVIIGGELYAERDGFVIVRAAADGVIKDKRITARKIPVESVEFKCAASFKHTESLPLDVKISPTNATYRDISYFLAENTAGARIESGTLYAERPGSVTVRAEADGVTAEIKISVIKEAVTNIALTADYVESDLGEALKFRAAIYPKNATYQEVSYFLKSGSATLTADGFLLIDIAAPIGSLIEVYAEADGVISEVYVLRAGKVSVKSVSLESDVSSVKIGSSAKLTVRTNPTVVSNPGVTYIADCGAEIIDGVLSVNDAAMVGKTVNVTAIVDGVSSNTVSILIEKTPVLAVGFTCGTAFKITASLALSAKVYPSDATYRAVTYSIVSDGDTGAEIIDGVLYANRPGVIKVRAAADGVTRDLIVHALKEPVTDVALNSVKSVKVNRELSLTCMVYPFNATYKAVRYELIDNTIGAEIWDGNIFYSSSIGTVKVRVYADDIFRDYEIEVLKEPVTDIKMPGAKSFKHTERLKLSAYAIPFNATFGDVSYEIIGGGDFAYISENYLYSSRPGKITLRLSADGYSVIYDAEALKNPVTGISFIGAEKFTLSSGFRTGDIELDTFVSPTDATYKKVDYQIISSYNCTAYITDGKLRVSALNSIVTDSYGFAKNEQAAVTVRAAADGVYTDRTFTVCKKPVEDVTLTQEVQISPLTNGAWSASESRDFKTSGKMRFSVNILSDYATYKDFVVKIGESELKPDKDGKFTVSANEPCTKVVTVTALCSGMKRDFEFNILEEKVDKVTLGTNAIIPSDEKEAKKIVLIERGPIAPSANSTASDIKNYKNYSLLEVQQSSQISIRAFASAKNADLYATYGSVNHLVLYYEADGSTYRFGDGESNKYFSYSGNIVTVKVNAPVNKSFYLFAKSKDGTVVSEKTQILVESKYITEIREAYIDGDGVIRGLEGLYNSEANSSDIEKVSVKIQHSSGISIEKTIVTKNPTMRLQLFNPKLGGSFALTYTVYFRENGNSYSYTLAGVNSFNGLKTSASQQNADMNYKTIVMYDISGSANDKIFLIDKNVKAIYIYGGGSQITGWINISTASDNTVDLYLDNIGISGFNSTNAIDINNNGSVRLTVKGSVKLSGGDSSDGSVGEGYDINADVKKTTPRTGKNGNGGGTGGAAIKSNCNLEIINNGRLYLKGGKGGNGGRGGNGEGSNTSGNGQAGHGGKGGDGGGGGDGLNVNAKLTLRGNAIDITSGDGGAGGNGGHGGNDSGTGTTTADDGGNGGNGGQGGASGRGIYAQFIENYCSSLTIKTGAGGAGGNGGNGGYAREIVFSNASLRGAGGAGGRGGNSSSGIVTYSSISIGCSIGAAGAGGSRGGDGGTNSNNVQVRPNSNTNGARGTTGTSVQRI